MRTVITLKPTKDGKTTVTRKQLFDRFVQRGNKRVRDSRHSEEQAAAVSEAYEDGKMSRTDAFNRLRGMGYGTDEIRAMLGDLDDEGVGDASEAEGKWSETFGPDGKKTKVWIPSKKTASEAAGSKDLFIGTRAFALDPHEAFLDHAYTGDRKRIVVHNHLPVRKAVDKGWSDPENSSLVAKYKQLEQEARQSAGRSASWREELRIEMAALKRRITTEDAVRKAKDAREITPQDIARVDSRYKELKASPRDYLEKKVAGRLSTAGQSSNTKEDLINAILNDEFSRSLLDAWGK